MVNRVMTVSERRYLKGNSTVFYSGQIFDHLHLSPIDIALKKLSLPEILLNVYHVA